jgi:hypothetical protein
MRGDHSNSEHRIATYGIWIPGVAFPAGLAVVVFNFYAGLAVISFALLTTIIVLFFIFPTERLNKTVGIAVTIAVYGITIWLIWYPAKSSVHGTLSYDYADFGNDVIIYDIKWKTEYTATILDLQNTGNRDLTNIDMYLWVDGQIMATGMAKGINTCTWENYQPFGVGVVSLRTTNLEGLSEIYLAQDKWHSSMLHIRCERLSANQSQIEMIFAIIPKILPGTTLTHEKARPGWAKLWISLMANYRPASWTISQCFIKEQCSGIPEILPGQNPSFLFLLFHFAGSGASLVF